MVGVEVLLLFRIDRSNNPQFGKAIILVISIKVYFIAIPP